jgi:LytS/YehU family sensor histidine kinase
MLFVWKRVTGADHVGSGDILITVAVIVICVIFVTNIYEKVLFTKHSEREKMRFEQLERMRIEAEMEALKNQIDPHFFFNTLNSISYLIDHDPFRAQKFIENLADVYRYILRSKDKNLVLLRDEVAFLKSYSSLIHLRHDDAFKLNINLDDTDHQACLIPPVSLMVAVENAVKHNEISGSNHLIVDLEQSNETITISNRISKRNSARESTGTGLKNLNERFLNTLGKGIDVINSDGYFKLQLPVLNLKAQ